MKINISNSIFVENDRNLNYFKDFGNGVFLYYNISLLSDKFVEYQKDIFDDFFADIIDHLMDDDGRSLDKFKIFFETRLQELNSKLSIFAEKLKDINYIPIRGIIQVFYDDVYLGCMIGEVSIMILRDGKLNYILNNELEENIKIDTFSDFVEGGIENRDQIVNFGLNISQYFDEEDIKEKLEILSTQDVDLIEYFQQVFSSRVQKKDINFILSAQIQNQILMPNTSDIKLDIFKKFAFFKNIKDYIIRFKYPITISLAVFIIVVLLYTLISSFISRDGKSISVIKDNMLISDISIEGLYKDLNNFKKLDPGSDEKSKLFEDINQKIKILEEKNKWPQDVSQLKKILNEEYYKGFKIFLITDKEVLDKGVYKFDDGQKTNMGEILSLYQGDGFMIGGKKGTLVSAVSDKVRGKVINYGEGVEMLGCSSNLLNNGLYCFNKDNNIFNIIKSGIQSVTTDSGNFPSNISSIGVFGKSSFYTFNNNNDLNDKGIFITKYSNAIGNQAKFGQSSNYSVNDDFLNSNKNTILSGFSSLVVDGTFLGWSKLDKKLYQFWKDEKSSKLNTREVKLEGGSNTGDPYSENIKVISDMSNPKLYLFDRDTQTFTIYRSNPYKNNSSYTTSYNLRYFFRLKFDVGTKVIDVFVKNIEDNDTLYILTADGVYQIKLMEYAKAFADK